MSYDFRKVELCRYHYDPLDRQTGYALAEQDALQRFYCESRLATDIHGAVQISIFRHDDQPLAQYLRRSGNIDTSLLAIDQKSSVLNVLSPTGIHHPIAYTPYGHHQTENALLSLPAFNGECPDPLTGCYHLGNGYRQFNPLLMRFCGPDNISPFGKGGLNAYAYCEGEPIQRSDPDGHSFRSFFIKPFLNIFTSRQSSSSLAKQMRTAKVVRLDGKPIKIPNDFYGDRYTSPGIDLYKNKYIKLKNLNLKLDRRTEFMERKNLRLMTESNFDRFGLAQPKKGQTNSLEGFKYFSHNANSAPMRQLLGSVERLDGALAANRMLSERTIPIAQKVGGIRGWFL